MGAELNWITLPNSGVAVDIPLLATRYTEATPNTSITPNIQVQRTFAARLGARFGDGGGQSDHSTKNGDRA
nr:hypothetical protein [uncultured Undibacterium sp.]